MVVREHRGARLIVVGEITWSGLGSARKSIG
jgi:hypothetical protein